MPFGKEAVQDHNEKEDNNTPNKLDTQEAEAAETPAQKGSLVGFLIQFSLVALVFLAIGFVLGQKKIELDKRGQIPIINVSNQNPAEIQNVDFSLFWEVFEELPKKYLDKEAINAQEMVYGAISGMVRSLGDPYTAFINPEQNELIKSDLAGSYEGVGIQIGFNEDKRLAVIAPLSGTPAERAGIFAKDVIAKIDDKDTFDITLPEAVELIRGPAGTKVTLTLIRKGETEPIEKEVERANIDIRSVEVEYREVGSRNIAIVKVSRFGEKTPIEWDNAIDNIAARNTDGVIVDMRNNPGGLLTGAIYLAGEFVTGTVVEQKDASGEVRPSSAQGKGRLLKGPVVVLINGGSASAAEIFAGALQDKGRAKIIGEQTFGKGTVQDVVDLPGGSALHVTIAQWLTPEGKSIQDEGITPDIEVGLSAEDREQNRDPQLDRALKEI
ncbi:hypothetical protein A3A54_02835 [Candidatus Curtissbacteria bacterium RIFCSPLOWO2_01_FULL_39_62]|uniref:PDZ domain-containing protein n=2 Tax=Candidatus Curtissiibacteriota TaxID=1752717 RepID=A0A1F5G9V3_9BACT|nr:MAG: hypothetical protein A2775_02190 [Candidatus Curtissbacteria bacterium RIFCSPHIGHO2_01_FULL_39_57]OGD88651.1 MAG: hypothetical protein A3D04_00270 [Candidatus Curtissbacteria bacterium RIFCSPHIGHO2_02_FULL_40_16b]OGD90772.1 MAG: hypothetical protein A3E11_01545 [Candidatus Curtissbacteria bacterium RIFCSPHIGHO2_12_FULL_38_37]OGD99474.1 MAG: hypothetical protein A3J17_01770 [Candidatus Curtissbacteria bacterium RIFCSPLOWO2_02_FULL_40_11]OGE01876.1 MAG: hypothetical protein A3A54_02835 [C